MLLKQEDYFVFRTMKLLKYQGSCLAESCCDRCADSFRNFDFVFKDPLLNSEVSISAISEFLLIQFIEEK